MNLTDTEVANRLGNGTGTPGKIRGFRRRTFQFSHLLREQTGRQEPEKFHDKAFFARTRPVGRASSVSLSGFSGPLLTTAGGALFCRFGRVVAATASEPAEANGVREAWPVQPMGRK